MDRNIPGFTLIEILVVIGIIAILATVVIIAINPARQFAAARNSQRESNITTILNGIGENLADNEGSLSGCPSFTASSTIGSGSGTAPDGTPYVDLSSCLSTYIPGGIPHDPSGGTDANTGYQISYVSSTGRYLVCAPHGSEPALGSSNPGALCVQR